MKSIPMLKEDLIKQGYGRVDADARLCQDIVLKALAESSLCNNATIKGGVVMRSISGDVRRATQDMDIDFIRYSLSEESIDTFISKLNVLEGYLIKRTGEIRELKQQDYHGRRVFISIEDKEGNVVRSKIDIGVHKNLQINQEEYCFDVCISDDGASLLINSFEQMFTEKLRSLLKFGKYSTRTKDVFDMYYLLDKMDSHRLKECMSVYIYSDSGMRENNIDDVYDRIENTFADEEYIAVLRKTDKNWLDEDVEIITKDILSYMDKMRLTDMKSFD